MANVLLLGECFPYRNSVKPFCNSDGKFLASVSDLTLEQLFTCFEPKYLINTYVHSSKKNLSYVDKLEEEWNRLDKTKYKLVILVGKRLADLAIYKGGLGFYTIAPYVSTNIACIPSPTAKFFWQDNHAEFKKLHDFIHLVISMYG